MIALLQRVSRSWVEIEEQRVANIQRGYTILLGIVEDDTRKDIEKLVKKIPKLRLFPNEEGRMDRDILQIGGEILVVSQFTLAGRLKKGNRPDFAEAMRPNQAKELYDIFVERLSRIVPTKTGVFGAMMEVAIFNDGPVTLILDSKQL